MFPVSKEKCKGDRELIWSHLEDVLIDFYEYNSFIVTDYTKELGNPFYDSPPNTLTVYIEPLNRMNHPLEYYVALKPESKRKIGHITNINGNLYVEIVSKTKKS